MKKIKSALIAAGGTGGHIFPALAFGRWILASEKAERVVYLSGSRPLEIEIYRSQGIEPYPLPLAGSPLGGGSAARNLGRWAGLIRSFFTTNKIFRSERPAVCFLFGGYVSLTPLLACKISGVPAVVHEQNAAAGKVTRLARRLGVPIAAGWDECRGVKDFTRTGVPIRPLDRISRREAAAALGLTALGFSVSDKDTVIGIAGGSLSSASLNALAGKIAGSPGGAGSTLVVLGDAPQDKPDFPNVRFVGRRWDTAPFYSLCDAVICRAGASTLAELAAYGIPALTIPWQGAAGGHQQANAQCFSAMTGNETASEGDAALDEKIANLLKRAGAGGRNDAPRDSHAACAALWQLYEKNFPD